MMNISVIYPIKLLDINEMNHNQYKVFDVSKENTLKQFDNKGIIGKDFFKLNYNNLSMKVEENLEDENLKGCSFRMNYLSDNNYKLVYIKQKSQKKLTKGDIIFSLKKGKNTLYELFVAFNYGTNFEFQKECRELSKQKFNGFKSINNFIKKYVNHEQFYYFRQITSYRLGSYLYAFYKLMPSDVKKIQSENNLNN